MKLLKILFSPMVFGLAFLTPLTAQALIYLGWPNAGVDPLWVGLLVGGGLGLNGATARQLVLAAMSTNVTPQNTTDLDAAERQIAAKYMRIVPWGAVIWAFSNLAVWLALWPLVLMDIMPLWLGFIIASINVSLCYLPSHEAQHNIIARRGQPYVGLMNW